MEDLPQTQQRLLSAGTELIRRQGFVGTSVDDICSAAKVSKGAFFHYFKSKEDLAEACLAAWGQMGAKIVEAGPFRAIEDPVERLRAGMAYLIDFFATPGMLKSCLAGTTLQEIAQSHPRLREAAHHCLAGGQAQFRSLIESAARAKGRAVDAPALAALWMATLQGAYILAKGSGDDAVVRNSLEHVSQYIVSLITNSVQPPMGHR